MDSSNSVQQAVAHRLNFEQKRLSQPKKQGMTGDQSQEADCIIPESLTQISSSMEIAWSLLPRFCTRFVPSKSFMSFRAEDLPSAVLLENPTCSLKVLDNYWHPRHKSALVKLHRTINH